ncbi:MAG: hypothetical protein LBC37_01185, partial [Zoogloeaceae bacterium]|nr:hypothetical protein [Zoogloeaceae bacterium]
QQVLVAHQALEWRRFWVSGFAQRVDPHLTLVPVPPPQTPPGLPFSGEECVTALRAGMSNI